MNLDVTCNVARGIGINAARILATGLRLRAKDAGLTELVHVTLGEINQEQIKDSVIVTFQGTAESLEESTAQEFAEHMGLWLNQMIDGGLERTGLSITVDFGKDRGSWRRN